MKSFLLLVFWMLAYGLSGQIVCKGILTDSTSGQAIEFANIGILGKRVGTVTNEKGEYSFTVPDSLSGLKVRISMVGYHSKNINVKRLSKKNKITLSESNVKLKEVTVKAKKLKKRTLGNETQTQMVSAGVGMSQLGGAVAVKLNIKHPQTHLRKFHMSINKNNSIKTVFRLNFYAANDKGLPTDSVIANSIIVELKNREGLTTVDLTPYHIYTDKDVFVSAELIKSEGLKDDIFFSGKLIGYSPTYFRWISQDVWEKVPVGVALFVEVEF